MSQKIKQDIHIGNNIRKLRKANKLTQEQVVTHLQLQGIEISRSSYSQIECGTYNIRVSELLALSELFQTDINSFFTDIKQAIGIFFYLLFLQFIIRRHLLIRFSILPLLWVFPTKTTRQYPFQNSKNLKKGITTHFPFLIPAHRQTYGYFPLHKPVNTRTPKNTQSSSKTKKIPADYSPAGILISLILLPQFAQSLS